MTGLIFVASEGLPAETSSLGDIEESDWEVDSDLCVPTTPEITMATRGSALAEREIRYIVYTCYNGGSAAMFVTTTVSMWDSQFFGFCFGIKKSVRYYTHSNNGKCLQKRFISESNLPKTDGKVL